MSLDDALLRRIDRAAQARGVSRRAYLSDVARRDVDRAAGPGNTSTARAALDRLDELFVAAPSESSTSAIRAERDAR